MNLQEFSTPGTYTVSVPLGSTVLVEAWGGGGGGGGGGSAGDSSGWGAGGGAGGAGGYTRGVITASAAGGTLTVVVGAGGSGGSGVPAATLDTSGGQGGVGGASSVSNGGSALVTALGGSGGGGGGYGSLVDGVTVGGAGGAGGAAGAFPPAGGYCRTPAPGGGGQGYQQVGGPNRCAGGTPGPFITSGGALPAAPNTGGAGGNGYAQAVAAGFGPAVPMTPGEPGNPGNGGYVLLTALSQAGGLGIQNGQVQFQNIVAGQAWQRQTVTFQPAFAAPPQVYVAVSCAEGTQSAGSGYDAQFQNVTATQADIIIASSAGTVSQVRVTWLAFGPLA